MLVEGVAACARSSISALKVDPSLSIRFIGDRDVHQLLLLVDRSRCNQLGMAAVSLPQNVGGGRRVELLTGSAGLPS